MQTELIRQLNQILNAFPEYWDNEKLQRTHVINDIKERRPDLIKALIHNAKIKSLYSTEIDGVLVFDFHALTNLLQYKEYWADSFTKYRNSVGLTSEGKYLNYNSDVVLDFPFKDCVLEGGMTREEQGKDEVYYNEIIARDEIDRLFSPKVLTNVKRYSKDGVEENITDFSNEDNLIIKGNNLIALHSLKERYAGKVKLIYIDPPFNTGNDSFKYNDRFNHSTWLTFMKNRLEVAIELLSDDGNIFIHIDINQSHILKVLCDDIFGEANFVEEIIWSYGSASGGRAASSKPVNVHDYILHYAKHYSKRKQNKIFTPYSKKYIEDWFKFDDGDGRIYRKRQRGKDQSGESIWEKQYLDESKGVPLTTVWTDIPQIYANPQAYKSSNITSSEIELNFNNSGQKPEKLIKRIIEMSTDENDFVLDFFMGSGTTASTACKMKRHYISIEQIEHQIKIGRNRLNDTVKGKVSGISKEVNWQGGGSFIYAELKELNYTYIHQIQSAKSYDELAKLFEVMKQTAHLNYQVELDKILNNTYEVDGINELVTFKDLTLDEQKRLLIELLDKNQLYVNADDMNDTNLKVSEQDKAFTRSFYGKGE